MENYIREEIIDYQTFIDDVVSWLQACNLEAGTNGVVFGISGGIDSAIIAALSVRAFGDKATGLIMPIESKAQDEIDARLLAKSIGLKVEKFDLNSVYSEFLNVNFRKGEELSKSNIKPRLRMTQLYYYAQRENKLVLGATNLSEYVTGYFTKWGDSGVDLLPIIDLTKGEVFKLAEFLKLPKVIIDRKPSAGLVKDQTDEEDFGFSYEVLDRYILTGEGPEEATKKINEMFNRNKHKRNFAKKFSFTRKR